jgi:putative tricarboxylic transport membrane protein
VTRSVLSGWKFTPAHLVHKVAAIIVIGTGLAVIVASRSFVYSDDLGPGPGFLPLWIGIALGTVGLVMLLTAPTHDDPDRLPSPGALAKALVLIVAMLAAGVSMNAVGFVTATFIFTAIVLPTLGMRRPLWVALAAGCGTFAIFYLFNELLHETLPTGPLGF